MIATGVRQAALAGALLALAAQGTAAAGFDGVWDIDCAAEPSDTRLTIAGSRIEFWESACTLENPVTVRDMAGAVLFDRRCTGEGETWTERILLMPGFEDRLIRVESGFALTYRRCR